MERWHFSQDFPLLFGACNVPLTICDFPWYSNCAWTSFIIMRMGDSSQASSLKYYHWKYAPLLRIFCCDFALIGQWMMLGPWGYSCVSPGSLHHLTPLCLPWNYRLCVYIYIYIYVYAGYWLLCLPNVKLTPGTTVMCIPGARAGDIEGNLKQLAEDKRKYSKIRIHAGVNDARLRKITKVNVEPVCNFAKTMSNSVRFSGPLPNLASGDLFSRVSARRRR